jgi:V/A-type H+-transporting ATPase subunit I
MVQEKTRDEALLKLREAGVIHLEKNVLGEGISKAAEHKAKIESALALMNDVKASKKKKHAHAVVKTEAGQEQPPYSLDAVKSFEKPSLPDYIAEIGKERKALQDRAAYLHREISRIESWGDFNPASIKEMASLGLPVYLYELNRDAFAALDPNTRYIKLDSNKTNVRIAVLDNEISGVTPLQLSEKSLHDLEKEVDEIKLGMEGVVEKLKSMADRRPVLTKEMVNAEQELEFENASAGMETVSETPVEFGLSYLTGYVPIDELAKLKKAASENNWALSMDDPDDTDEAVPTKLKNNSVVNLLNPITDFLGIVPG